MDNRHRWVVRIGHAWEGRSDLEGSGGHALEHNASRRTFFFFLVLTGKMGERALSQAKEMCRERSSGGGHVAHVIRKAKTVFSGVVNGMVVL